MHSKIRALNEFEREATCINLELYELLKNQLMADIDDYFKTLLHRYNRSFFSRAVRRFWNNSYSNIMNTLVCATLVSTTAIVAVSAAPIEVGLYFCCLIAGWVAYRINLFARAGPQRQ